MKKRSLIVAVLCYSSLFLPKTSFSGTKIVAEDFDEAGVVDSRGNKVLNELQAELFFASRKNLPVSFVKLVPQGKLSVPAGLSYLTAFDKQVHPEHWDGDRRMKPWEPFLCAELDAYANSLETSAAPKPKADAAAQDKSRLMKQTFVLRSCVPDLMQSDVKNAKAPSLGLQNNNLAGGHVAWNGSGAFGYRWQWEKADSPQYAVVPNIAWNIVETQGGLPQKNVEDIAFSVPVNMLLYLGTTAQDPKDADKGLYLQVRPYVQTDFSLTYKIYGTELSMEPQGYMFGPMLYFGTFHPTTLCDGSFLQYQLHCIPRIDYSAPGEVDLHTTRQVGDDWFRVGGLLSLDFRLTNYLPLPLDIGASFETLQGLKGNIQSADLFSTYGTVWVNEPKDVAVTVKYAKGYTMQSLQKTDQVTVGLSYKF